LDEGQCAGVSTKSEAAVRGNLIQKDQRAVQGGKVTEPYVKNPVSRETALSKSCGKINVIN